MTSAYQINDVLPKDSGGQKFFGLAEPGSVTSFTLVKAVGGSVADSKKYAWQAIATHTLNGEFGASPGFVVGGGLWLESQTASAQATSGKPGYAQISQHGELLTNSIKKTWAMSTASTQTHLAASAGLYGVIIAWEDINAGNKVIISDGSSAFTTYFFPTASGTENLFWQPNAPLAFATSIKHTTTIGANGTASITVCYTAW